MTNCICGIVTATTGVSNKTKQDVTIERSYISSLGNSKCQTFEVGIQSKRNKIAKIIFLNRLPIDAKKG